MDLEQEIPRQPEEKFSTEEEKGVEAL